MNIILFTASYPYDIAVEQSFLAAEVDILAKNFDRVFLVPRTCTGNLLPVPSGVDVVEEYSEFIASQNKHLAYCRVLLSSILYREMFGKFNTLYHSSAARRFATFLSEALLTKIWLGIWIEKTNIKVSDSIFYTFWFFQYALGIGMAKSMYPELKLVSRAHGGDLYEERYSPPYIPCRSIALSMIDAVYPDSDAGTRYLRERYPVFSRIIETARMGTVNLGFLTKPSRDGVVRIVSCAMIRKDKRIDLLLRGIALASHSRSERQFVWHHFGNGEDRGMLQSIADSTFPANAKAYLPGYTTQEDLFNYYRDNSVDVFMLVSESEGTPVAIMEAISCGIPVIATAVGGNTEIVSDKNGILLSPNPSPDEIAQALLFLVDHPNDASKKRDGSFKTWQELYSVENNMDEFIRRLKKIRGSQEKP
jgi:colanic acid/amylovoran biosynthesis glycosyltransferase